MMNTNGMLKVKVIRGKNLAVRDLFSSDPYVKIKLADQSVKTHVKNSNLNPEWNEELTLCVPKPLQPLKIYVFDYDALSADDLMGEAEIDLQPLLASARHKDTRRRFHADNMVLRELLPDDENCLVKKSLIKEKDGHVLQELAIKLSNVESGELELELTWISQDS